jgi:hypothetical protein
MDEKVETISKMPNRPISMRLAVLLKTAFSAEQLR